MTQRPGSHPNPETLLSYVAGTLPNSISCVVACHGALCPRCADEIRWLETLGGLMLGRVQPEAADVARLEAMAERMATETLPLPRTNGPARRDPDPVLPPPLAHYLEMGIDEIPWRKVVKGVRQHWVSLPQGAGQIRLLRLAPGKVLLEHTHTGMELTMVLQGIYGDHSGEYGRGDVIEWMEGSDHQPHAGGTEDCVCMIATESAPRYHSLLARLVRPILGF